MQYQKLPNALFNEFMGFIVKKNEADFINGHLNAINISLSDLKEYFRQVCDSAIINSETLIVKCGRDNYLIDAKDLILINQMAQNWLKDAYGIYMSVSNEYRLAALIMIERGNLLGASQLGAKAGASRAIDGS